MNPEHKVYDDHDEEPVTRPDLRALEGGGETSEPKQGHLSAVPDEESSTESPKSLFNAEGDTASSSKGSGRSVSPHDLSQAESTPLMGAASAATGGITAKAGAIKNLFWGTSSRRKKTIFGGGAIGLIAGGIFGLTILSGPAQLIQLSAVLQHPLAGMSQASSDRLGKLTRYAGARDLGETRMGTLGRQILRPAVQQLSDAGIDFTPDALGTAKATIDIGKLKSKFPGLENMSTDEQRSFLSEQFDGITPEQFQDIGGGKFEVNTGRFNSAALSALRDNALHLLPDGTKLNFIENRVLAKYLGINSLFHPLKKLTTDQLKKLTTPAEAKAEEENRETTNIDKPLETTEGTPSIRERLKGEVDPGAVDSIGKGLMVAAVVCTIHNAADDAVALNHAAIVMPAEAKTADLVAVGEQVKSGQDTTIQQVGAVEQGLTDDKGQTVWQGKALQALEGNPTPTGSDLPTEYAQAFSGKTTADSIKKTTNIEVLGINACSGVGEVAQVVAGLALLALAIPTDGSSFAAWSALKAGETAGTMGVFSFFQHELGNLIKDKAIVPAVLSGPLGGNIMAYGARAAANTAAMASGGIQLAGSAAQAFTYQQQQQDKQQFRSESFFARTFDINDYRSLAGRLADSITPSFSRNMTNFASVFANFGSRIPKTLSALLPHASAANQPYDWGFPLVGIPNSLLSDPALSNPYENATTVQALLQNNGDYMTRATSCFGVTIDSSTADITVADHEADPNSQAYTDSNCSDTKDPNWRRVIMFVFDTRTMQAAACYTGDDQSCSEIGYDTAGSSSSSGGAGGGTSSSSSCSDGSGNYSALVSSGASFAGTDQGIDFVPSGSGGFDICAPASGTITLADQAGHHFDRTPGQAEIIEKLDQNPNAPDSSQYIYYAEIIQINNSIKVGARISAGDVIGHNAQSPGIEVGWGQDPVHGFLCSLGATVGGPTPCGRSFNDWIQGLTTGKVPS